MFSKRNEETEMRIVLYTEITFANKTVKEYLQYIDRVGRIVTTATSQNAKVFKSHYEAMKYVEKHTPLQFNVEELK